MLIKYFLQIPIPTEEVTGVMTAYTHNFNTPDVLRLGTEDADTMGVYLMYLKKAIEEAIEKVKVDSDQT